MRFLTAVIVVVLAIGLIAYDTLWAAGGGGGGGGSGGTSGGTGASGTGSTSGSTSSGVGQSGAGSADTSGRSTGSIGQSGAGRSIGGGQSLSGNAPSSVGRSGTNMNTNQLGTPNTQINRMGNIQNQQTFDQFGNPVNFDQLGNPIDQAGNRIMSGTPLFDQFGNPVSTTGTSGHGTGRFSTTTQVFDQSGNSITFDQFGNPVDQFGNRISTSTPLFDRFGNPVTAPSIRFDQFGNPVDEFGNPINESERFEKQSLESGDRFTIERLAMESEPGWTKGGAEGKIATSKQGFYQRYGNSRVWVKSDSGNKYMQSYRGETREQQKQIQPNITIDKQRYWKITPHNGMMQGSMQ